MLQLLWPQSTQRVAQGRQVNEVQMADMPTTLPQETGDHGPELQRRWRVRTQDKEKRTKDKGIIRLDEEVTRE